MGAGLSLYAVRGVVVGSNFAAMVALAWLLPLDVFGTVAFAWSATLMLSALIGLGAQPFLVRELSFLAERGTDRAGLTLRQALWLGVAVPLALAAAAAAGLPLLAAALPGLFGAVVPDPALLALAAAAGFLVNLSGHAANLLRVTGRLNLPMLLRDAGPQLVLVGTAALLALRGEPPSATGLFAAFLGAFALVMGALAALLALRLRAGALFAARPEGPLRYPLHFWGVSLTGVAWTNVDILVGGAILSPAQLGVYQLLKRVANLGSLPQVVVNWLILVPLGRAFAAGDRAALQAVLRRGARAALWPLLALLVLCAAAMPVLARALDLPLDRGAWIAFAALLAGAAANVAFGSNFVAASQCRLERFALGARLLGLAVFLGGVAALPAGFAGLAGALLAAGLASNLFLWRVLRVRLGVDTSLNCCRRSGPCEA